MITEKQYKEAKKIVDNYQKQQLIIPFVSESCVHEYKDSSHYVIESEETYKCELSGEEVTETNGYTQYEDTCIKCGDVNSR